MHGLAPGGMQVDVLVSRGSSSSLTWNSGWVPFPSILRSLDLAVCTRLCCLPPRVGAGNGPIPRPGTLTAPTARRAA